MKIKSNKNVAKMYCMHSTEYFKVASTNLPVQSPAKKQQDPFYSLVLVPFSSYVKICNK